MKPKKKSKKQKELDQIKKAIPDLDEEELKLARKAALEDMSELDDIKYLPPELKDQDEDSTF